MQQQRQTETNEGKRSIPFNRIEPNQLLAMLYMKVLNARALSLTHSYIYTHIRGIPSHRAHIPHRQRHPVQLLRSRGGNGIRAVTAAALHSVLDLLGTGPPLPPASARRLVANRLSCNQAGRSMPTVPFPPVATRTYALLVLGSLRAPTSFRPPLATPP